MGRLVTISGFLEAIDTALALDAEWSYFINLSGQCYPLRPLDEIAAALAANAGAEYVELRPLSSLPADDWHLKWMPMVETPFRAVRLPGRRRPPKTFTLGWKGSQWVMLTRAFCEWQQHSRLRTDVSSYLSHSLLSDEVLTQSLLMNSPFSQNVSASYARDIVWPGPKVLDMDDWPRLSTSRAHFARKFDAKIDREVLLSLARKSGFPEGLIAG